MTTTPPTAEGDLMELVRGADPLDGHVNPATDEAAESLLAEILAAPRPKRSPRTRPSTKAVVRLAAVGAAAAGAFVAITAITGDGRGVRSPPPPPRSSSMRSPQLPSPRARSCMWTCGEPRTTATAPRSPGGTRAGRRTALPTTAARSRPTPTARPSRAGTWATASRFTTPPATRSMPADRPHLGAEPKAHRNYRISPGPTANTYTVRLMVFRITQGHGYKIVPGRGRQYRLVITSSQAKALKDGSDLIKWVPAPRGAGTLNGYRPAVVPAPAAATAPDCSGFGSQDYGDQILTLLRSCGAHLVGHATIGGRDTLELRSQDGHITYYVDASSYAPVQLDTTGTDGGTSLRFTTYEVLPANDANQALLSLTAQHPSATVDRSQADYLAAEKRLFPNG